MVTLDWETDRTEGVTLVRLYVTAENRRRVRIENCLDGSVWPPREEGQPAAGWDDDDDAFEGVVAPDHRLVAGYATPAPPTDPPAEIVADDPADAGTPLGPVGAKAVETDTRDGRAAATDGGSSGARSGVGTDTLGRHDNGDTPADGPTASDGKGPTPEGVVRSLGDPVVPREAVPVPDAPEDETSVGPGEDSVGAEDEGPVSDGDRDEDRDGTPAEASTTDETGAMPERAGNPPEGATQPQTDAELVVPGAVRAWLRDVDRRLAAVERRQAAEATDPDPTVQIAVAGDRRALARVADRVETLVGRARAVERGASDPGDGGR
jgi:hypothetical protein